MSFWSRIFRQEAKTNITRPAAGVYNESGLRKGGVNIEYHITKRPPPPAPMVPKKYNTFSSQPVDYDWYDPDTYLDDID